MMNKENLLELESLWPDIDPDRRRIIMQQLVDIAEQSFEVDFSPIFLLALKDPDSEVQAIAIGGLWEDESTDLIPSFVYLLKQGQTGKVRAAAAIALGRYVYLGELEEIDDTALMVVEQALLETIRQPDEDIEVIIKYLCHHFHRAIRKILNVSFELLLHQCLCSEFSIVNMLYST